MGRPRSAPGGRPATVATRLSLEEAAALDEMRGALSRAEYLRFLFIKERRARQGPLAGVAVAPPGKTLADLMQPDEQCCANPHDPRHV